MTHLILFRHGIAVPSGTPDVEESQRPLTKKGEKRTREIARGLKPFLKKIDRIVSSPLPRALRTAEIVAEVLGLSEVVETSEALLPQAQPVDIQSWLKSRDESRLMIVGHNPNLSDLLNLLVSGHVEPRSIELRKAGAACLRQTPDDHYRIDWFIRPRIARKMR